MNSDIEKFIKGESKTSFNYFGAHKVNNGVCFRVYAPHSKNVDVYVNVYYGYNVSEIAYRVQENIKSSIASMIEIKIDRINVHVMGVDFPKEEFE